MKNVRIYDTEKLGESECGHISHIPRRKYLREQCIKKIKHSIAKNTVPYPNKKELEWSLMISTSRIPRVQHIHQRETEFSINDS